MCALSLVLIALTLAFHLTTRYDWWFGGTFNSTGTVEVASCGQSGTATEPIPLEHEGQQVGVLLVGLRAASGPSGWPTGRSSRSWPLRWR